MRELYLQDCQSHLQAVIATTLLSQPGIMENPTQKQQIPEENQTLKQKPSFLLRKRKNIWVENAEVLRNKKPSPVRPPQVKNEALSLQQVCGWCGITSFSEEELQAHETECRDRFEKQKAKSHTGMVPSSLVDQAHKLPDFWNLVLQSLDIYVVPAEDLPLSRRSQTPVVEGSVAICCAHCAVRKVVGSGTMYFPGQLGLLQTIVYKISDAHLMDSCPSIPKSIQAKIRAAKPHTSAQTLMEDRITLVTYLKEMSHFYHLSDGPGGKGIRGDKDSLHTDA